MNHYTLKLDVFGQAILSVSVVLLIYFSVIETLQSIQILVILLSGAVLSFMHRTVRITYIYDYNALLWGVATFIVVLVSGVAVYLLYPQTIASTYYLVLVAVAEEVFVRGFLLPVFARYSDPMIAVLGSSVVWSTFHIVTSGLDPSYFIYILVSGVIYGSIAVYTRSLTPSLISHVMVNIFAGVLYL